MMRWRTLLLLALTTLPPACKERRSHEPAAVVKAEAPPPSATATATATTTVAPAAVAPPPEPDVPPFDQPIVERAVFRHVVVGGIVFHPQRLTWTLERGTTKARLGLTCQRALSPKRSSHYLRLDGEEMIEESWSPAGEAEIRGDVARASPLRMRFSAVRSTLDKTCGQLLSSFELSCKRGEAPVLAAGASLVIGPRPPDSDVSPHSWAPPAREIVGGLVCDVVIPKDGTWLTSDIWRDWQFFFTRPKGRSPGVEWAHENSDAVVQQGAYRWMPPSPSR